MESLVAKAKKHLQEQLPFVLYCKPNADEVIGFFQHNATLFQVVDFSEKGFVFTSFDGEKTCLIPENQSDIIRFPFQNQIAVDACDPKNTDDGLAQAAFESLVTKGIESINQKEFKKVVLSRIETVALPNFDLIATFQKLLERYPSTFVYCFYHPKVGTWLGATPEQLLKANDGSFETISLAGTQKDTGKNEITWNTKEQEEQQFVTDYIVSELGAMVSEMKVSDPYSVKAGSIWHIKTNISGRLSENSKVEKIIGLLHPTPAVCGLPKSSAKSFIIQNESYDRSFYTGYLGELNCNTSSAAPRLDLFVNLRCMQIKGDLITKIKDNTSRATAYLYMGCGITKDSIPEKEWEESVNKSLTMKKVL